MCLIVIKFIGELVEDSANTKYIYAGKKYLGEKIGDNEKIIQYVIPKNKKILFIDTLFFMSIKIIIAFTTL